VIFPDRVDVEDAVIDRVGRVDGSETTSSARAPRERAAAALA
jgi:hypothetical protein